MSVHAEDPVPGDASRGGPGRGSRRRRPGADAMSAHAEDPFQVTPHAANRGVGVAVVDRVPMP